MLIKMTTNPPPQPIDISRLVTFGIAPRIVAELTKLSGDSNPKK